MPFSLSPKENFLACLRHEKVEYTPSESNDIAIIGGPAIDRGVPDGFGVPWSSSDTAANAMIPEPGNFLLADVTEWKKAVTFPDVDSYDWEGTAAAELAQVDRDKLVVEIFNGCSLYERLAALMGFENALIAMAEEPEATYELAEAIAEHRIRMIEHYAKYYTPDVYVHFDDVATEKNLFMSPKTYRELIAPHHTKIAQAALNCGMIPVQHTCGYATDILDVMIEEGNYAWHAVQPTNDLEKLIPQYEGRFTFIGGFNTNGAAAYESASEEALRAEVRRSIESYGRFGYGYIFFGTVVTTTANPNPYGPMIVMADEVNKIRAEQLALA